MEEKKKLRIAICDDSKECIDVINGHIRQYFAPLNIGYEIYHYMSGKDLLEDCKKQKILETELLFLDVEMPEISGLEVKQRLGSQDKIKRIVFCTSHNEVMRDAFGVKVAGFMTKPVKYEDISKWIDIVRKENRMEIDIAYENGKSMSYINLTEIEHIEADKDYTLLYRCNSQDKERVTQGMKYWEDRLPKGQIVRIHKSYFVNLEQIAEIGDKVVLDSGKSLPIGRKYKKELIENYQDFIWNKMRDRTL